MRVESSTDTDLVLGTGAAAEGASAHLILPATASNGYATAGLAFARTVEDPNPVRFRFPKITDEEIELWDASFIKKGHKNDDG